MSVIVLRVFTILWLSVAFATGAAFAQSGDPKAAEKAKQSAEQSKDSERKADDFAEAAKAINGPAGNPECVWLGRRMVGRLYSDDLDTAFRHLDLYDRFGCPGGHIQAAFRCVIRQGDLKAQEKINARVQACWINPSLPAQQTAAPLTGAAAPSGTTSQ